MTTTQRLVQPAIDPFRLLKAIARIGYTPDSALCDLIDNAVAAHARAVNVVLETREGVSESRRNSASRYLVIDDGDGMDEEGLENAMSLGSSDDRYEPNTLAKFGLGLKSASLSQGDLVSLLSATSRSEPLKITLDMSRIEETRQYECLVEAAAGADLELWEQHLGNRPSGTIVQIERIHQNNHPSVKATTTELKRRVGLIYYYFLTDGDLDVSINGEPTPSFDPLFVEEANENGDLDETQWDGTDVRWMRRQANITINADPTIQAQIEATQLPHPQIFGTSAAQIREKYMIGAGNYGVYVYRNRRLISWAEGFGGIVPQQQELYAYRGRLLIDSDADDALNIDVTKSHVHLSDETHKVLDDEISEHRRMSREAWNGAYAKWKAAQGTDADSSANEKLAELDVPDLLPSEPDGQEAEERRQRRREREKEEGRTTAEEEQQVEREQRRVILVDHLDDSVAWQRAYDPSSGVTIARLSRSHRFIRDVYGHFADDEAATLALHSLFFGLANGEARTVRNHSLSEEELEDVFLEYRRMTSEFLYQAAANSLPSVLE